MSRSRDFKMIIVFRYNEQKPVGRDAGVTAVKNKRYRMRAALGSLVVVLALIPSLGHLPAHAAAVWHDAARQNDRRMVRGGPRNEGRCRAAFPPPLTQMGLREGQVVLLDGVPVPAAHGACRTEDEGRALAAPAAAQPAVNAGVMFPRAREALALTVVPGPEDLPLALPEVATLVREKGRAQTPSSRQCRYRGEDGDCHREAYYGKERKSALWCRKHRQEGDVDVRNRRCVREGCNRFAVYGSCAPASPKQTTALPDNAESSPGALSTRRACRRSMTVLRGAALCARHRRKADKDLRNKRCQHPDGCVLPAKYGLLSQGCVRFCKLHRTKKKHIYLASKRCELPGCLRAPSFGNALDFKARFCAVHKRKEDVHVKWRLCQHPEGCHHKAVTQQSISLWPALKSALSSLRMPPPSLSNSSHTAPANFTGTQAGSCDAPDEAERCHTTSGGATTCVNNMSGAPVVSTAAAECELQGLAAEEGGGGGGWAVGAGVAWAKVSAPSDAQGKPPYCKICHRRAISGSRVCPHFSTAVPGGVTTPVCATFRTGVRGRRLGAQLQRQKLVLCRRHLLQAHASLRPRSSSRVAAEAVKTLSFPRPSQCAHSLESTSPVADSAAKHKCLRTPRLSMSALVSPGAALGGANATDSKGRRGDVPREEQHVLPSRCFVREKPKSPPLLSLSEPLTPPTLTLPAAGLLEKPTSRSAVTAPPLDRDVDVVPTPPNAAKTTHYDTCAHALAEAEVGGWDGSAGSDVSKMFVRDREVEGLAGLKDSEEGGASPADQGTDIGEIVMSECVKGSTLSPASAHSFHARPSLLPRRGNKRRISTGALESPRALPATKCKQEFSESVLRVATSTLSTIASSPSSAGAGGRSAGGGGRERDAAAGACVGPQGGGAARQVELREDSISWYKRLVAGPQERG